MGSVGSMVALDAVNKPHRQAKSNRLHDFGTAVKIPPMVTHNDYSDLAKLIQRRLDELNISARAASIEAGLSPDAIRNILRQPNYSPRGITLEKLAKVLKLPLSKLYGGVEWHSSAEEMQADDKPVVKYGGKVEAGMFRLEDNLNQDAEHFPAPLSPDPRYPIEHQFGFEVGGDSMNKAMIFDGMWILGLGRLCWERFHGDLRDGKLVVASRVRKGTDERELTVKRLRIYRDRVELHPESDNPKHKPLKIWENGNNDDDFDIDIIAVVLNSTWVY